VKFLATVIILTFSRHVYFIFRRNQNDTGTKKWWLREYSSIRNVKGIILNIFQLVLHL